MKLQITEEGRAAVETEEFALLFRSRAMDLHRQLALNSHHTAETKEVTAGRVMLMWLAWSLTGGDLREFNLPEDDDDGFAYLLTQFIDEHEAELNGLAARIEARCGNYDDLVGPL
jgi:hypothetical protein